MSHAPKVVSPFTATSAGSPRTLSAYVKSGGGGAVAAYIAFDKADAPSGYFEVAVNLTTGVPTIVGTAPGCSVTTTNAGGGWWRVIIVNTAGFDAGLVSLYLIDSVDVAPHAYLWYGLQVEAGTVATAYAQILA